MSSINSSSGCVILRVQHIRYYILLLILLRLSSSSMKASKKLLVASTSGTTPVAGPNSNSNSSSSSTTTTTPMRVYFGSKVKSKKKLSVLKKRILRVRTFIHALILSNRLLLILFDYSNMMCMLSLSLYVYLLAS